MIQQIIIYLVIISGLSCHPQRFQIPDLDISTPEEVNSLELEEPLGRSIDPQNNSNNINDTVKEVEEIIKSNPSLPRLTRGEILDLLENITKIDKQQNKILKTNRKPKAVMVVMPYTPTNDKNMEELYTKAPVTKIIGAEPFKVKEETEVETHSRRRPLIQYDNDLATKTVPEEPKKYSATISEKPTRTQIRRKRPEPTHQPTTHQPTTQQPTTQQPTTQQSTTQQPTTYHPTTRRSIRRRTTTTKHPNHRYTNDFSSNEGLKIIDPPKLKPHRNDITSDLDFQENIKHEVSIKTERPISASLVSFPSTTIKTLIEDINFPDNLKTVVKDLSLEEVMSPESERLRAKIEEHNRIKNLLASIGVIPQTTTTTTTAIPNAENVAESLSPEMRDLLMSFGLLPNPNEKLKENNGDTYYPEKAEVKPESYIGFKPLPDDGPSREDMDALLASFGLGRSARKEKSIKINKNQNEENFNFDMIPEDLKTVISDLGIENIKRESKKIESQPVEKQHVFNPDTQYATDEELKKLEKLIAMIKQLEKMNGTATEEDLKKIDIESLKELVSSLNEHNETLETLEDKHNSPDPTTFDVGVIKNEVKRQESTSISVTIESTTASTVIQPETPSLKDLEESFGGSTEAVTEPPIPETTTKRTGFYYLVDWNTFLDIDDTKGKRVNLRFQPTIGDPKRFLSVSVP